MPSVPRLWPGQTICCIASGPSLTHEDCARVRGRLPVIAVNSTIDAFAPWADILHACDYRWWLWHKGAPDFLGLKFTLSDAVAEKWPDVTVLRNTGDEGLERDPTGVRTGKTSGYQAINIGVHTGAARILLLGYDMQVGPQDRKYCHPDHPIDVAIPAQELKRFARRLEGFRQRFDTIVAPLHAAGVEVLNCSRETALRCFPSVTLEDALERLERAA